MKFLVEHIAERFAKKHPELSKTDVSPFINQVFSIVADIFTEFKDGDRLTIVGFGSFKGKERETAKRTLIHRKTKKPVKMTAKKSFRFIFTPAQNIQDFMRDKVNKND